MDKRKNNRGTIGNKGGGRPSKAEEQKLFDKLKPIEPEAFEKLHTAIKAGERWAIELFFAYYYGKPKQMLDVTTENNDIKFNLINVPPLKWVD